MKINGLIDVEKMNENKYDKYQEPWTLKSVVEIIFPTAFKPDF